MIYTCSMHPEIEQDHPGTCPKCGGMKLVPKDSLEAESDESFWSAYKSLFVIVGLIALVALVLAADGAQYGVFAWQKSMTNFMAGFFFVFSGFKFLDLKGFAEGYASYDLLAQKVFAYGYVYPFLELGLGLAYATGFRPGLVNLVTFALMIFSGVGVTLSLLQKKEFQCACLGTFIKVPLTKVTIIEDFGMAVMAAVMLLY